MTVYQVYLGEFTVGAVTRYLTVDATQINGTAFTGFTGGYTGEGSQFVDEVQTHLVTALGGTPTCTYSAATNRCTITLDSSEPLTWYDDTMREALGFAGDRTASDSHVGDQAPKFTFAPSQPISLHPVHRDKFWTSESQTSVQTGKDGTTRSVVRELLYYTEVGYQALPASEVRQTGDDEPYCFQDFFDSVCHKGREIRCIIDDTSYTATADYERAIFGFDEVGPFEDYANRTVTGLDTLWDVRLELRKYSP